MSLLTVTLNPHMGDRGLVHAGVREPVLFSSVFETSGRGALERVHSERRAAQRPGLGILRYNRMSPSLSVVADNDLKAPRAETVAERVRRLQAEAKQLAK